MVGHHGIERTMRKLIKAGEKFMYMREFVKSFIMQCPCCQKMKELKTPIHTAPFTTAPISPMHTLNVDTIGPFPETPEGYKYIINIKDKFTRYVELYPAKDVTSAEYSNALLQHFGRWGNASVIQSDMGSQFVNEVVEKLHHLMGVSHNLTIAYSKEENAIVERSNKEVNRHLRAFVYEITTHSKWQLYLPFVARIINTEVHDSTGVAPCELIMNVRLDKNIIQPTEALDNRSLSTWADEMISTQSKLLLIAEQRQRSKDEEHIRQMNHAITEFAVNSFVLCSYPKGRMGALPPTKLHTSLKGPFRVIKFIGPEYTILNLVTNKTEVVHVKRLQPFYYNALVDNPQDIAAKDYQEFRVERVLKHSGDARRKSSLDFLVRWQGYDETEDLWLPWKELRDNIKLHDYLRSAGLQRLLPKHNRNLNHND